MDALDSENGATPGRKTVLWRLPTRVRSLFAGVLTRCAGYSDIRAPGTWILLAGVTPPLLAFLTGWGAFRWATGLAAFPLLTGGVLQDSHRKGLLGVALIFALHSGVMISLAARAPQQTAAMFPAGREYWEQTSLWIETGQNSRYDPEDWLPVHFALLATVALAAVASLGLTTLLVAAQQLDRMNYYVGRLVAESDSPVLSVLIGWHPWSICRGLGYLLVVFEMTSLAAERVLEKPLSTRRRRQWRWAFALLFVSLDVGLKWSCTESVRLTLQQHLR